MKKIIVYVIVFLCLITSCKGFSNEFFEMLLNTQNVGVDLKYSNKSSFDFEGITFEVYEIQDSNSIIKNITNVVLSDTRYNRYDDFKWTICDKDVPNDLNEFIAGLEDIDCKEKSLFLNEIKERSFYYTILTDYLKQERLFVLSRKTPRIYYVSKYEL